MSDDPGFTALDFVRVHFDGNTTTENANNGAISELRVRPHPLTVT